jgi:hypothetical protein
MLCGNGSIVPIAVDTPARSDRTRGEGFLAEGQLLIARL